MASGHLHSLPWDPQRFSLLKDTCSGLSHHLTTRPSCQATCVKRWIADTRYQFNSSHRSSSSLVLMAHPLSRSLSKCRTSSRTINSLPQNLNFLQEPPWVLRTCRHEHCPGWQYCKEQWNVLNVQLHLISETKYENNQAPELEKPKRKTANILMYFCAINTNQTYSRHFSAIPTLNAFCF